MTLICGTGHVGEICRWCTHESLSIKVVCSMYCKWYFHPGRQKERYTHETYRSYQMASTYRRIILHHLATNMHVLLLLVSSLSAWVILSKSFFEKCVTLTIYIYCIKHLEMSGSPTPEDWEKHREIIENYYLRSHTNGKHTYTLGKILKLMAEEHGFYAK